MTNIPYGYLDVNSIYQPNFELTYEEIIYIGGTPLYSRSESKLTCACGEPLAINTVHRKDNPCYAKEELTDEEITNALELCDLEAECFADGKLETKIRNFARAILKKGTREMSELISSEYILPKEFEYSFIAPAKPVGYWCLYQVQGYSTQFAVWNKPTDEQIKNTEALLGWKWKEAEK